MEPELQSLKICAGWNVTWHSFYDLEPTEENMIYFSGSSLFTACNPNFGYFVDLEWRPEEDIEGEFILKVMPFKKGAEPEVDWDRVLLQKKTKNKELVVKMLNKIFIYGIDSLENM